MKERPILFSAPMVRALLDGSKTQTRRVVKPQPRRVDGGVPFGDAPAWAHAEPGSALMRCPYGKRDDRLWVREPWRVGEDVGEGWTPGAADGDLHLIFDSDGARDYRSFPDGYEWPRNVKVAHNSEGTDEHWISYGPIPSIFMPRWASRILLEVTAVRVERLQDISRGDAMAEGCPFPNMAQGDDPRAWYADLWQQINAAGRPVLPSNPNSKRYARVKAWLDKHPDTTSWDANPWVWVVEFQRQRP